MEITPLQEKKAALGEMKAELLSVKKAAEEMFEELKDTKPEEVSLDDEVAPDSGKKEKEEHPVKIETPEDAKKVLDEAKEDIQQVIDNIEGVIGQTSEEETKIAFKRMNDKYASSIDALSKSADNAITDAKEALSHWAFLKQRIAKKDSSLDLSGFTDPTLKQVASTVQQVGLLERALNKIGFVRKEATAVPPTGAEFSGDKWPKGKDPKEVETRHWEAGANEFHKNVKKENNLPNPAVDNRLIDAGNPHDEKPFVNASFNLVEDPTLGKAASYYDVYDGFTGKAIRFSFANAPANLGAKDEKGLKAFASDTYKSKIIATTQKLGLETVRATMNGVYIKDPKQITAAKSSDKSSLRKYYSDAYGDPSYARELTSTKENKDMNIAYSPEEDKVKENNFKTKQGPGKLSAKADLDKKALEVVKIARMASAAGNIPFTKAAIKDYAANLMKKSSLEIEAIKSTLQEQYIVNEAALKEATIPDAESGIVGNSLTGVSEPKGKVDVEGLDSSVAGDAKIAKKASFVPQMQTSGTPELKLSNMFTTTEKRLQEKGVLGSTRVRKAQYRS